MREIFHKFYNLDFGDDNVRDLYKFKYDFVEGPGRQRRGVVNDGFTAFNTGTSMI